MAAATTALTIQPVIANMAIAAPAAATRLKVRWLQRVAARRRSPRGKAGCPWRHAQTTNRPSPRRVRSGPAATGLTRATAVGLVHQRVVEANLVDPALHCASQGGSPLVRLPYDRYRTL